MKHAILAMDRGHPGQLDALRDHFRLIRPEKRDPDSTIRLHAHDIKGITTFLTPVRAALIEQLPNLEIVSVGAVGLDHIDLETLKQRNIAVTHTPGVLTDDTADIALMLMLSIARKGVEGDAYIRAGLWQSNGALQLGTTLKGKTCGIVGLGRIGRAIAHRAKIFGMTIAYTGPNQKQDVEYDFYNDIISLAENSHFLVLACPANENTDKLVTLPVLKALGPKGYLINIARGSIIDEQDLLIALSNRDIAGAGLDVFAQEPHVPDAFFTMDHVVLSPHQGSATTETRTKMGQIAVGNLLAYFNGEPLLTPYQW